MKIRLVRIGNSQGIRIPAKVIEECGFSDQVEMRVRGRSVVVSPARRSREGWEEAFSAMAKHGDDAPLLPDDLAGSFDKSEWRW